MKYTVEVGTQSVEVEISGERVTVNGRVVDVRLGGRRGDAVRQLVGASASRAFLAARGEVRGSWLVSADGARISAQVLDARALVGRRTGASQPGRRAGHLKAPMPGLVVRVLTEPGAHVEAGQGLVVVEAMKMENELKAPRTGKVSKVLVRPGARVEKGALLVELEGDGGAVG